MAAPRPNAAVVRRCTLHSLFPARLPTTDICAVSHIQSVGQWMSTYCVWNTQAESVLSFIYRVRCECKSRVHSSNWRSFHVILLHHSLPYSSRHFLFASQNHSPFVRQYTTRFSFIEAQVLRGFLFARKCDCWRLNLCLEQLLELNS